MESSHFWPSVLHVALCKTLFLDFLFRPLTPKIYSQNLHKIAYKSDCIYVDRRCLDLPGGFRGWPIQWNQPKCSGAPLVAMATKFGLGAEIQSPTGLFPSLCVPIMRGTSEVHPAPPLQLRCEKHIG